jgi:hypothetical protein
MQIKVISRTLSFAITAVYTALGDRDEAFAEFEPAWEEMFNFYGSAEGAI